MLTVAAYATQAKRVPEQTGSSAKVGGAIKQNLVDKKMNICSKFTFCLNHHRVTSVTSLSDRRIIPVLRIITLVMMQNLPFPCVQRMRENDNNFNLIYESFFRLRSLSGRLWFKPTHLSNLVR